MTAGYAYLYTFAWIFDADCIDSFLFPFLWSDRADSNKSNNGGTFRTFAFFFLFSFSWSENKGHRIVKNCYW